MDMFRPWHDNFSMGQLCCPIDETARQPPVGFVRLVRDALAHLYDPAHLLSHPLQAALGGVLPGFGDPAQQLRNLLIDAVESLAPPKHGNQDEKRYRPYIALVQIYVSGFTAEVTAANLHIGARQLRREQQKGVEAVAFYLWSHRAGARLPTPELAPAGASLQTEVEALGLKLEPIALAVVAQSVRGTAESLARRYGVVFSLGSSDSPLQCNADRTLARQALLSCLSAVVSRRPRCVEVSTGRVLNTPALQVKALPPLAQDGIAALEQNLDTCRSLMALQGGSTSLVRDPAGNCAAVRLLFRPERAARVLIVDDNTNMLHLYRRYLAAGNYEVMVASSAAEAEASLAETLPNVIVLDVMMRDTDGWELLQRLRARPELRHVPILVCSVLNEPGLALSLGAQAYLKKPVTVKDLLQALEQAQGGNSRGEPNPAEL